MGEKEHVNLSKVVSNMEMYHSWNLQEYNSCWKKIALLFTSLTHCSVKVVTILNQKTIVLLAYF